MKASVPLWRLSSAGLGFVFVSLCAPGLHALQSLGGPVSCRALDGSGACAQGRWKGPFDLGISCFPGTGPTDCTGLCFNNLGDEIGHAALIPVDPAILWIDPSDPTKTIPIRGKVLLWTACDRDSLHGSEGYRTHIWDPEDPQGDFHPGGIVFHPPIVPVIRNSALPPDSDDGPFPAGHAWVLDSGGDPKLLTIGGLDRGPASLCGALGLSQECGLPKAYWFDPLAPSEAEAWSDAPADFSSSPGNYEGLFYPGVVTVRNGDRFDPLVVGGSPVLGGGCGEVAPGTGLFWQYDRWWTLASDYVASSWVAHPGSYLWHEYPRAFLLDDAPAGDPDRDGEILAIGHTISCEYPYPGTTLSQSYGGSPAQEIQLPDQAYAPGTDPNPAPAPATPTVGGLHYCNAAILHTLIRKSVWNAADPLSNYDLNRVIVTGGTVELFDDAFPVPAPPQKPDPAAFNIPAQPYTLELRNALTANESWQEKAPAHHPRVFGNLVPLPDGTLLLAGGQDMKTEEGSTAFVPQYRWIPERLDPGRPGEDGVWTDMARHPVLGMDTSGQPYGVPRGYHHVALLLQDGTVAVLGGKEERGDPLLQATNPVDSVEVFEPPYVFESQRLRITGLFETTMHYKEGPADPLFYVTVNRPARVAYACLLGIGSVTHFFNSGARYVELMARPTTSPNGNVEILPPPDPAMAPEGYYLLFVVELRAPGNVAVPCARGQFVKVTF